MPFEIGDYLKIEEIEEELKGLDHKKRVTILFSIRAKLFKGAGEFEYYREKIFEERARLAALFRDYGGERHAETAEMLEGLTQQDDVFNLTNSDQTKFRERKEGVKKRPYACHIYGPSLSLEQKTAFGAHINSQSQKMGSINNIGTLELLHVLQETYDKRPILITMPLDEKFARKLHVIIELNPPLAKRIFILAWNGEAPVMKPITEDPTYEKMSSPDGKERKMIHELGRFIYHRPSVGELFVGCVDKVTEFGVFVEFLPGVCGLAHKSRMPEGMMESIQEGDIVPISITEIERHERIRISITEARDRTEQGEKPLFANCDVRLLADGMEDE